MNTNQATAVFTNMFSGIGDAVGTGLAYCDGFLYGSAGFFNTEVTTIHRIDPRTGALSEIFNSKDILFNDLTSCPASDTPPATPTATGTPTPTPTNTAMPPTATETTTPTNEPSAEPTATNTWAPPTATLIIDATAESPDEPGATGTPRPAAYHQYIPLVLTSLF